MENLLADISALCGQAAAAAAAGGRDTHRTEDVLDDGGRELVAGVMSRLMYESMAVLYPFCKRPVDRRGCDTADEGRDAYVITLDFPYERSEAGIRRVRGCIHSYVVYKCVAEWLALTLPDTGQWQTWEQKAQDMHGQLTESLVLPLRPKSLRVRQHFY